MRARRASASEYLDNILTGQLRKYLMPILEELPLDEKVRRGNVLLKTRPRDVEETLLQLINDDDQVVAAAAIDVVRQQKLWALADDIEHVLAHRDVRDWYVFEAASWALAEHRMPAERRRELWLEPLPAAELAGRLRGLPLVRVGQRRRAVPDRRRVAPGAPRAGHGAPARRASCPRRSTFCSTAGSRSTSASRDAEPYTIESPAALGFVQALQGRPMRRSMRTIESAVTLAITADELRTLLADNTDLVRGLFATLADRVDAAHGQQPAVDGRRRASSSSSRPAACCRSRRSSRCSACRSSRGSPSKRCGRSADIAQTVPMTRGRRSSPSRRRRRSG